MARALTSASASTVSFDGTTDRLILASRAEDERAGDFERKRDVFGIADELLERGVCDGIDAIDDRRAPHFSGSSDGEKNCLGSS